MAEGDVPQVEQIVDDILKDYPVLVKKHGKKVFEIRPDIAWDKGQAVLFILKSLGLECDDVVPLYVGIPPCLLHCR